MDGIGGIGATDYSAYIDMAGSASVKNNIQGVNSKTASDEEMMAACKEFEVYMLEQVYKQMEKTVIKAEEEENEYEEYFSDYRTQAYAKAVSEQGNIGLAEELFEAMKRNNGEA